MGTGTQSLPLQIGRQVRRLTDTPDARPGVVAGLVFVDPVLALVCWEGTASSFEPEESLVEVFQPRL